MCMDYVLFVFYFEGYCDHRDLAVLTHSFPTHRSSVLSSSSSAASSPVSAPPWAKQSLLSRATAGPGCGGRRRVTLRQPAADECGDAGHVTGIEQRYRQTIDRRIARHGDDLRIIGLQHRLAGIGAPDLDLRMRLTLEALDQHEVDRCQPRQQFGQPDRKSTRLNSSH